MGTWFGTHQIWKWTGDDKISVKSDAGRFWRTGTHLTPMSQNMCYVPDKLNPLQFMRKEQATTG